MVDCTPSHACSDHEEKMFNHWMRLDKASFKEVYDAIKNDSMVVRMDTRFRKAITPKKRLVMTLVWLAHGMHFKVLGHCFGVGTSTACNVVHDTINAMARILPPKYIKFPRGAALQSVMADFEEHGGMPGCAGAIDGCLIPIIPLSPPPSPTSFC